MHRITSLQNPLIKEIVKLQQKSAGRAGSGRFVVEGRREVSLALRYNVEPEWLIVCPEFFTPDAEYPIQLVHEESPIKLEVSGAVYNKLAYREKVEGVILVAKSKPLHLHEYKPERSPLIILLEGIEKPGNLGAILRTTDAAGVDAVILCDSRTDIFNPNTIRSSLGCVFSQKLIQSNSDEAIKWLKSKGIPAFATSPGAHNTYFEEDLKGPAAIVFGAEDTGLSSKWLEAAEKTIKIPMGGIIDSLNVGASVAIVTFEAVRQRLSSGKK